MSHRHEGGNTHNMDIGVTHEQLAGLQPGTYGSRLVVGSRDNRPTMTVVLDHSVLVEDSAFPLTVEVI